MSFRNQSGTKRWKWLVWVIPSCQWATKNPGLPGLFGKRLKGLEPSTFCMASRRSSQLSYSRAGAEYNPEPGQILRGG